MSMLDAHIPQLVASEAAFGAKAALMRSTIAQAEQAAQSAQAFHMGESSAAFQAAHARFVEVSAKLKRKNILAKTDFVADELLTMLLAMTET